MQKLFRSFIGPVVIAFFIISVIACATSNRTHTAVLKPGFYGITQYWNNGVGDIDGEMGYRLFVGGPRAKCITCTGCSAGSWSANSSIVSGSFPPGLSFSSSGDDIVGIPTDRGTWVVVLKMTDVTCNGSYYKGFEQELRFHIKGTLKVH